MLSGVFDSVFLYCRFPYTVPPYCRQYELNKNKAQNRLLFPFPIRRSAPWVISRYPPTPWYRPVAVCHFRVRPPNEAAGLRFVRRPTWESWIALIRRSRCGSSLSSHTRGTRRGRVSPKPVKRRFCLTGDIGKGRGEMEKRKRKGP